jgi:hypothetical protein
VKRTAWFWISTQLLLLLVLSQVTVAAQPQDEVPLRRFVAASLHAAPQAALKTQPTEKKQITVRIRNYAHIDSGVLLKAETRANKILQEAGAEAVWVVCFDGSTWSTDMACSSLPGPMDLTVNMLPFPRSERFRLRGDVFGYAAEDGEQGFGCDAWIFYDSIKSFAVEREMSLAQLLGHVFAHELGHLLLGTNSHSGMGLMRSQWSSRELFDANHGGLFFSASESRLLQKAVLARWQADSPGIQTVQAQQNNKIRLLPEP